MDFGLSDNLGDSPQRLAVPLACWHESLLSARSDALVALSEGQGFIATDRPLPEGTRVFLELSLGTQSNAPHAEIDAVVVWTLVEGLEDITGFGVKFEEVDDAVRLWIGRHLQSAAAAPTPAGATPLTDADLASLSQMLDGRGFAMPGRGDVV